MSRHFLSQNDLSREEIVGVLDLAQDLRREPVSDRMRGRSLVMFFEKASTRTRLSFEIGMTQLGGHAVYVDRESSQLSRGESIADTARVVSRYADVIMARVNSHDTVMELARHASIPVINGLSDREHPAQTTSDLLTMRDRLGRLEGLNVAYVGDAANNVAHSLMLACTRTGANIRLAAPDELQPDPQFVRLAGENGAVTGATVSVSADPAEAVDQANVIYTDVWVSMGQESERSRRMELLRPYQVDGDLVSQARPDYIFMHCLPQHVGDEVTEEVAYGPHSVIFDQAESRLHVQKALILFLCEVS